jgi:tRNA-splicing ligase RtcB
VREAFEKVLGKSAESLGLHLIYDVAHNIAKFEEHVINDKKVKVCVHRKGATRAFVAGHPDMPHRYKSIGQPVLIPGDMGTHSYLLLGTEKAMTDTFGSTCHGAGRLMSRTAAIQKTRGRSIEKELMNQGIFVMCASDEVLHEEVPEAYKDIDMVVEAVHGAGISRKVCRVRPVGVVKG